MAPLLPLSDVLTELGLDPGPLMAEAGLDGARLDDPERPLHLGVLGRVLAHCAERSRCPHLGLLVGLRSGLEVLGVVGELARHAPDLATALGGIVLHLHLHDRAALPALWESGDRVLMGYVIYGAAAAGTDQIYDGAVAILYNLIRQLAGPCWEATEVWFPRARPADPNPYRSHFRAERLRFAADRAAVVFARSWLACPVTGADPRLYSRLLKEVEGRDAMRGPELPDRLRRTLRRILIGGAPPGEVAVGPVCQQLKLHRRTLNRRLERLGTSFRAIADEIRYEAACQLLRDTGLPVVEVAAALCYADAASFSRAFRRWSGTTPAAWRAACGRTLT